MPGLFARLFGRIRQPKDTERAQVLSASTAYFSPFSGDAYASDIYRAAVDAIARNAAKLRGVHVVTNQGQRKPGDNGLNRILQTRWNPYMTAYDGLYKLVTHYYLFNNAFAYLQKDERGNLQAIWPLRPQYMEFVTDPTGTLYCRFMFAESRSVILPFSDVLILRRHFNSNDLLGDDNSAIFPALDLANTQMQGVRERNHVQRDAQGHSEVQSGVGPGQAQRRAGCLHCRLHGYFQQWRDCRSG